MQSVNGAQFLKTIALFILSNSLTTSSSPAPVVVIVPLTVIHTSP